MNAPFNQCGIMKNRNRANAKVAVLASSHQRCVRHHTKPLYNTVQHNYFTWSVAKLADQTDRYPRVGLPGPTFTVYVLTHCGRVWPYIESHNLVIIGLGNRSTPVRLHTKPIPEQMLDCGLWEQISFEMKNFKIKQMCLT